MRPRMVLRALRPPMLFGASLPGMIFPAQHPAEGSNSYHYGSYATHIDLNFWNTNTNVSIPLWFLRNIAYTKTTLRFSKSFHTTMVLTQRIVNFEFCVEIREFPYHYGSYATKMLVILMLSIQ